MRVYLTVFVLLGFGSVTLAQTNSECPPGPFECVPWDAPGGTGNPAPPPPPFFEVEPSFILPQNFQGYLARGNGFTLEITEEELPETARRLLDGYAKDMDPTKLYVMPFTEQNSGTGSSYILFNGVGLE